MASKAAHGARGLQRGPEGERPARTAPGCPDPSPLLAQPFNPPSPPPPPPQVALAILKRSVKKRAGFSVDKVSPLDTVANSFTPALFGGCWPHRLRPAA